MRWSLQGFHLFSCKCGQFDLEEQDFLQREAQASKFFCLVNNCHREFLRSSFESFFIHVRSFDLS